MYFRRLIPIESHAHRIGSAALVVLLFDKTVPCTVQVIDIPREFFHCYSLSARNVFVTERSILLHNWQSPIFLWLWWRLWFCRWRIWWLLWSVSCRKIYTWPHGYVMRVCTCDYVCACVHAPTVTM